MNDLRNTLDRELDLVQGDPAALAAIRRRVAKPPRRARPWLVVAGGLVPIGAAAIVAAVLLTGHHETTSTTNPTAVGVIQQASNSPSEPVSGPSAPASASPNAGQVRPAFPIAIRVGIVPAQGYDGLSGTVPQLGLASDFAAGPGPDPSLDAEQAAIAATNTIIRARISGLPVGAFGAARAAGTVTTEILDTTSHTTSVYVSVQTTTTTAAHPDDGIAAFVVDLDDASIIDPNSFFTDETKALGVLSEQSTTLLMKQIPAEEFVPAGVAPTEQNFQRLTPTPTGLRVDFAYYQVGPRPVDAPHVTVPWSVVDPLLTPGTARLFGR